MDTCGLLSVLLCTRSLPPSPPLSLFLSLFLKLLLFSHRPQNFQSSVVPSGAINQQVQGKGNTQAFNQAITATFDPIQGELQQGKQRLELARTGGHRDSSRCKVQQNHSLGMQNNSNSKSRKKQTHNWKHSYTPTCVDRKMKLCGEKQHTTRECRYFYFFWMKFVKLLSNSLETWF